ncbi:MAG: succinate dehydrogenase cytochrome b subunit [Deltaproteobacteria bacterium]|nr:succinate dehydrogenase cytochrome b subunit [Deltaproteobacteria bacterium]
MNWFTQTIGSSIGKKLMMALTGFCFIGFLTVHLAGNLTVYGGADAFNSYSEHLHALGPLVTLAEWGLLTLALIHVLTGTTLFYQNVMARPVRYKISKRAGGRTIGSATMPYTGFLVLAFAIFHLINFHFVDKTDTTTFQIVSHAFGNPIYIGIYITAMIVVAIHVSHGFWSAFQTLGANHPKYTPFIMGFGIAASVIFGIGFGFLPLYISFIA